MESNFKRNLKKRVRETKTRSHIAGVYKRKREKEQKRKLSNYEKAIRKFNLNQQLNLQRKLENKRITKGQLKIKPTREGMFLKARKSAIVKKKPLNDANEARKNEDINRIIDIANEMFGESSGAGKVREKGTIFTRLNLSENSDDDEDKSEEESELTESESPRNHKGGKAEVIGRQISPKKKHESRIEITSDSSMDSLPSKRHRKFKERDVRDTSAPGMLEDYLLGIFARSSSSADVYHRNDSPLQCRAFRNSVKSDDVTAPKFGWRRQKSSNEMGNSSENQFINLDDFEKYTLRFENAIADVDCSFLTGHGVAETALASLRCLYREKRESFQERKTRKEVHFTSEVEFKCKKMHDPVMTWVLNEVPPGKSEKSPETSFMDAWNSKFQTNIFTFSKNSENRENSKIQLPLFHDSNKEYKMSDDALSPKIKPINERRKLF